MYVDYTYYRSIYGDEGATEKDFNRLSWDADRMLDIATTGVDNYKKLRDAFPVDKCDAETVRRCACKMINFMWQVEQSEKAQQRAHAFVERDDGTFVNKVVSSVSSGTESISYSTSAGGSTAIDKAVSNRAERNAVYRQIIRDGLSGVVDKNGVNLLYMGVYPCITTP